MALDVIVGVRDGKVAYEHIPGDPAGLPIASNTAARLLAFTGKG